MSPLRSAGLGLALALCLAAGAARAAVDARVQRIYGGTNEIMKEVISRSLGLGGDR